MQIVNVDMPLMLMRGKRPEEVTNLMILTVLEAKALNLVARRDWQIMAQVLSGI